MRRMALTVLALTVSGMAFAQMHGHDMGGSKQGGGMQQPPMQQERPMRGMEKEHGGMQMNQAADELADGEVRKVDRESGKLTLRHGPIASLDMPSTMTMVYGVKDPTVLEHLSVGDKVKFAAEKTGAGYTVTKIERSH